MRALTGRMRWAPWRLAQIFTGVVLFLAAVVVSTISYIELRRKATATTDLQAMMPQTVRFR